MDAKDPRGRRMTATTTLLALVAGLLMAAPAPSAVAGGVSMGGVDRVLSAEDEPEPTPLAFTTPPSVSGTTRVGETLMVDPGETDPPAVTFTFQWLRDGSPIAGATAQSHTAAPADLGAEIAVVVTASYEAEQVSETSEAVGPIRKGRLTIAKHPWVKGKAQVGRKVRAKPAMGSVDPRPTRVAIRWFAGGKKLEKNNDRRSLRLTPRMRGDRLRVVFIYVPPAGYQRSRRVAREGRITTIGKRVRYPGASPKPKWTSRNRWAVGKGPNPKVQRIPNRIWRSMKGRSWHRGCPVGRPELRMVRVNFWDYSGDRRRGEVIVHRAVARRAAAALAAMYRGKYPMYRMHRVDRFGWSRRLQGANDYASMRADNTSAFNCRSVVGRPGVRSPHSYGRAIDINPWENPYYSPQDGWVPNRWWVGRSHPRIAWRSTSHPVVRIWRSHGFRWSYGNSDAHHFDGRVAPGHVPGSFVSE